MSVSARTFQVLYIIRQRALDDLSTKADDVGPFIAARRKATPTLYEQAYLSPTAISDLLNRMSTTEGLLTAESDGTYQMTPQGSQMADLLRDLNACADSFIEGYKEQVVLAALQQRHRLGQGPANQREIAALTNISLDSVRRGLGTLIEQGRVVEDKTGRVTVYALAQPPFLVVPDLPKSDNPLAGFDDDDEVPPNLEAEEPDPVVEEEPDPVVEEDVEEVPLSLNTILQDEATPEEVHPPIMPATPVTPVPELSAWAAVPANVQQVHIDIAKALNVSLEVYLEGLAQVCQQRMRNAVFRL